MRAGPSDPPSSTEPANDQGGPLIETDEAVDEVQRAAREDQIRRAAYRRWQERGGEDGSELADWLDAEREVDGRH